MKLFTAKCFTAFLTVFIITLCGCKTDELLKTYNMKKCEYSFKSITNVTISGINVSNGISVTNTAKIALLLSDLNQAIPLNFLLTLDVKNPTDSEAAFRGIMYKITIDGINFSEGAVNEPFNVAAGETKPLPIKIGTDISELIKKNSKDAVINMVKNFIGLGKDKTKVHVELKPKFLVGGKVVTSPAAFPIDFTFGGK